VIDKKIIVSALTAIGASLCCITPVLAVLAGSTGFASSFSWIEPFRPYLITLTVLVLAYASWDKLNPKKQEIQCACEPDEAGKVSFSYSTTFLVFVSVFSAVMLSFPYWGDALIKSERTQSVVTNKSDLFKKTIQIKGMTCGSCEATVEKVAMDIEGVVSAKASTKNKNAVIEFDKSKTDMHTIMKAIATTGYKPLGYEDENSTEKHGSKK
jgi:copper chaperone CopZ